MKNIIKSIYKIVLIFLIIQIIFSIGNISNAFSLGGIIQDGDSFLKEGKNSAQDGSVVTTNENGNVIVIGTPNNKEVRSIISDLYTVLTGIGVAVTVIIGGVLGIKFMLASAEDKAKVKESFVPYLIGCIVIYGALGIWKLVIIIFSGIA